MTVGKICTRTVDLATLHEPVQQAASRMRERNVGSLVVVDDDNIPVGLVTDRDLTVRHDADGGDPARWVHAVEGGDSG